MQRNSGLNFFEKHQQTKANLQILVFYSTIGKSTLHYSIFKHKRAKQPFRSTINTAAMNFMNQKYSEVCKPELNKGRQTRARRSKIKKTSFIPDCRDPVSAAWERKTPPTTGRQATSWLLPDKHWRPFRDLINQKNNDNAN